MGKGKKGKGKVEFLTDAAALAPFDVNVRDMISTPLGVQCTVVGVRDGALWLEWPGGIVSPATPAPESAPSKERLLEFGYARRPESAHVQRSINERLRVRNPHSRDSTRRGARAPCGARVDLPARFILTALPCCSVRSNNTSRGDTGAPAPGQQLSSCPSVRMVQRDQRRLRRSRAMHVRRRRRHSGVRGHAEAPQLPAAGSSVARGGRRAARVLCRDACCMRALAERLRLLRRARWRPAPIYHPIQHH
jgi:hypothetical protein